MSPSVVHKNSLVLWQRGNRALTQWTHTDGHYAATSASAKAAHEQPLVRTGMHSRLRGKEVSQKCICPNEKSVLN